MTSVRDRSHSWVYETPLFCPAWYEAAMKGDPNRKHPAEHFANYGMTNLADPHPLFHSRWYQQQHPEIADDNWVPLHHYLLYGWKRNFRPNPFFDVERYRLLYAPEGEPLTDYVTTGWRIGRHPNSSFDSVWYVQAYSPPQHISPLEHFMRNRPSRKVEPNPLFDSDWYGLTYPDAADDPYLHFILYGEAAGAPTTPVLGKRMWEQREFDLLQPNLEKLSQHVKMQAVAHV